MSVEAPARPARRPFHLAIAPAHIGYFVLSIRIVRAYDINSDVTPCRLDIMYGVAALNICSFSFLRLLKSEESIATTSYASDAIAPPVTPSACFCTAVTSASSTPMSGPASALSKG